MRTVRSVWPLFQRMLVKLQQFSVDLNQDGLPRLGEDLRH
jgi:hypothetical protein